MFSSATSPVLGAIPSPYRLQVAYIGEKWVTLTHINLRDERVDIDPAFLIPTDAWVGITKTIRDFTLEAWKIKPGPFFRMPEKERIFGISEYRVKIKVEKTTGTVTLYQPERRAYFVLTFDLWVSLVRWIYTKYETDESTTVSA